MQSAVVPPRRNQDALPAAPPQVQLPDMKQVQVTAQPVNVVRLGQAPTGAPCAIQVAPSFAPTRAGVSSVEQPPAVQVPVLTGTHNSGAVSPPVPLASHGHSSVLSVGSISLSSMPTAAWPSILPGQAPTRGRTNVITRQAPQVVSRYASGTVPPGSKPCSVATPSRGSALSVAEVGEARCAGTGAGTAESREASQQPLPQGTQKSSGSGVDADKSARQPSKGVVASPKKEPASVRVPRSPSPRREEDASSPPVRRSASQADLRSEAAKKRTQPPPKSNAGAPEEASMLRLLQRDAEELRAENLRLQEKLCKSRSLVLLLQKQADEARADKEKEHRRAEGLQTQLQQLNKQLRKEIARGQQMERAMSAAGHRVWPRGEPTHRQDEDNSTPVKQRGTSPSRNGNSVSAPPFSYSTELAPTAKDDLYDSLQDTSLPAIEAASLDNSLEVAKADGATQEEKVMLNDEKPEKGPEVIQSKMTQNLMASHPQLGGEGTERSWEFVVQGQYEPADQEDFAAKLVSCFPDNAVEKAWSSGVAFVCTRGRRMDTTVPNQDDFLVARHTLSDEGYIALYGIFDGHGPNGHLCAAFARGSLPESIFGQHTLLMKPEDTLREAFRHTQMALADQPFDTQHSGTTAALALVLNVPSSNAADKSTDQSETWLFVAHVGDSRIILASHREDEPSAFSVTALTRDHRPDDAAEAERVQNDGGEVRKLHRNAGNFRVFAPGQERPGLALTRSLGDFAAADCGVIAEPEVAVYKLRSGIDALLMLGTDGLFEFCSNTDAASKLLKEGVTATGLESLCAESRRQWAASSYNETVDDITAVVATLPTSPSMTAA
mmetsp:Transcript_58697/g.108272  ORF Transcript_58697/g.108272 Transcript_58697/m.108272 type:complete len:835 (-) Transcript_58697:94-2598(-)